MKSIRICLGAALAGALVASEATAMPFDATVAPEGLAPTAVVYGYGPQHYGVYTHWHRHHARRSYGTGYHGRGTRTGGPVGGLPSRN